MTSLTIEGLQEILREDQKARESEKKVEFPALRQALLAIWEDCREHRRPAHSARDLSRLYRCPISAPVTTLVPWVTLPRPVQKKILEQRSDKESAEEYEEYELVEVPLAYLLLEENTTEGDKTGSDRRPLHGNLTTKLSEYTRGMSGQTRPFKPGGGMREDSIVSSSELDKVNDEAALEQSLKILELTRQMTTDIEKRAERDALLESVRPKLLGSTVGITARTILSGNPEEERAEPIPQQNEHMSTLASTTKEYARKPLSVLKKTLFSRDFFEEDSLFGSTDSDDDEEDFDSDEEVEEPEEGKEKTDAAPAPNEIESREERDLSTKDDENDEIEDVDVLLRELSISTDESLGKVLKTKKLSDPLELAQQQAEDQKDATRKSWASTKTLPMSAGIEAYVPSPALTYPFELDDFQKQAVARLERSESVFVAAHTSAGKTVVAEYAVALAKQRSTRCVYTSPIKALSNQKFRDFGLKFGVENVGLITGDLQVNVDESTVLIMTTEILRSMLYRGADLIRDIEFVIFDEVHYVNDTERGVVWEEVIIMLPSNVNLVFLSATTPNTIEFSDWIGRTKRRPVHVVTTTYRPVPLSHFLWAGGKLHKILEGKGPFLDKGYADASKALLPASMRDGGKTKGQKSKPPPRRQTGSKQMAWQAQGSKQNWMSLVRFLDRELLTPSVIFSFSKKKCEEIANMLRSLDLNAAKERSAVQGFTLQTVARLSENDAKLPQVLTICEMAARGIGVHHGGLLPILKEMVEILFSRNLIKVLLATETFAMGVNMPAKAVVFNSLRKHDGTQFRSLEPGEYTQMAGRAGRRGLDKVGTVIICCFGEEPPPQQMLRTTLTGRSTTLRSQFRLTYNMILNLLRVEEISVESMIKRSFSEFATQRALTANEYPKLLKRGKKALRKMEEHAKETTSSLIGATDIDHYYTTCNELLNGNASVLHFLGEVEVHAYEALLHPGRVLLVTAVRAVGFVRAPCIVLKSPHDGESRLVCLVLLPSGYAGSQEEKKEPGTVGHIGTSCQRKYMLVEIQHKNILLVSSKKRKIDPKVLLKHSTANLKPSLKDPFAGLKPVGKKNISDPFAGMKPAGKNASREDPSDFFGGIKPVSNKSDRDTADFFGGMKPAGKKSGRDDALDFFGGRKASGKKSERNDNAGTKGDTETRIVEEIVTLLVDLEREELHGDGIPSADIRSVLKRGSDVVEYRKQCDRLQELVVLMRTHESHRHPNLEELYLQVERRETLRNRVDTLQHLLSSESLQLFPDFLQRKAVLMKLGYVDDNETVRVKGRVACEVNTCEELIATEMIFEGTLNEMEPEEIAAVLSALVFQEKSNDEPLDAELPSRLVRCCDEMKTIAINLGQLQKEQGLDIDPNEYCDKSMKFGLVHVVYEWALGVPFKNICELSDVQEGSIVRTITRLDELCREVRNCARVIGNPTLYRKLEAASVAIKRDIVFASSLYVS